MQKINILKIVVIDLNIGLSGVRLGESKVLVQAQSNTRKQSMNIVVQAQEKLAQASINDWLDYAMRWCYHTMGDDAEAGIDECLRLGLEGGIE